MFRVTNVAQTVEKFFDDRESMLNYLLIAFSENCDMSDVRVFSNGDEESLVDLEVSNECRDEELQNSESFWDYVLEH